MTAYTELLGRPRYKGSSNRGTPSSGHTPTSSTSQPSNILKDARVSSPGAIFGYHTSEAVIN